MAAHVIVKWAWEATGLPYGVTSANDLLLHYADCILCDMLRRTDVSALSQTNCRLESVPTADRAHTLVRPYNGMCRWISLSDNLFFPSDRARACLSFLRIGPLPAGIGWCSPITALPHACRPVRWWIRFAAAKPRRLKRATGTFLRADAPFRARV